MNRTRSTPSAPPLAAPWQRIATARISRRRALAAAGAGALATGAMAIAGCDGGTDDKRGGTLRFGTSVPLGSGLDPQVQSGTGLAIVGRAYGYLFHLDSRDDSLILDHAESVEQPDETTYVIRLRDDLRFHDVAPANGRKLNATDVAMSIERFRDNPLVVNKTRHTTLLDAVGPTDERTLVLKTKRPNVYSLHALGDITAGAIFPKESIDGNIDATPGGPASGPFAFAESALPSRVRLERFGGYHGAAPPAEAMEWQIYDDDGAPVNSLNDKFIDILACRDRAQFDAAASLGGGIVTSREPALSWLSLGMDTSSTPFSDARVRRAADLAIDRAALIEQLAFGDGALAAPVSRTLGGGFWALTEQEIAVAQGAPMTPAERTAEARRLLEAAGAVEVPFALQVSDQPELRDAAAAVAADLRRAGFFPIVQPLPLLAWYVNYRAGDFAMTLISHLPYESPDTPMRMLHSAGPDGTASPFGMRDEALDRLVERSWAESDRAARRDTVVEAQRRALEARPLIHLFSGVSYAAAWDYVRDWQPELPGSLAFYDTGMSLDLPVEGRPD